MKKFWIRTINVCVIMAALIGYNKVTLAHEQTDAAAKAEADRKNAEIAAEAGVKRFWLAHYSPMITDPAEFLPLAQAVFSAAECGFDGKQIILQYEEN